MSPSSMLEDASSIIMVTRDCGDAPALLDNERECQYVRGL